MGFGLAADVKHHAVVLELNGDGFIRVDPIVGIGDSDLARLPSLASVIAKDRCHKARAMGDGRCLQFRLKAIPARRGVRF